MSFAGRSRASTWTLRTLALCLALGGSWELVRAHVFKAYTFDGFALQAGSISLLTSLVILARLRSGARNGAGNATVAPPVRFSLSNALRLIWAVLLLAVAFCCHLWWVVRVANGYFLQSLRFGLLRLPRGSSGGAFQQFQLSLPLVTLGLWALCLLVCPRAPQIRPSRQRERLRAALDVCAIVVSIWTYPYTDPFSKYVQWSGLHLMVVATLAIWHVVAWLRGEAFVTQWLDFFAATLIPDDFCMSQTRADPVARRTRAVLAAICMGAMTMQAINISWGLPPNATNREFRQIHPDEKDTFEQAWRMYLDPQPVAFVRGGCAFFRLGMFAKDVATYFSDPEFTVRLQIILLRWVNVAAVGGYVLVVYACGVFLFDRRVALLSALVMAILPGNVVMAHLARPEAIFTFLSSVGLYAALRAAANPQWLLLGGFVAGISTATKITGVGLFAPLLVALVSTKPSFGTALARAARVGLAAAAGYVIASFETFFFLQSFIAGVVFTRNFQGARDWSDIGASIAAYLGPISGYAWTVPGTLLLWTGAILAVRRRRRECLVLIAFLLAGHLISFTQRDVTLRSHVHLSSAVSLLSAYALTMLLDASRSAAGWRRAVLAAEVVAVLFIAHESLGHVAYLRFGSDARSQIRNWVEAHIAPDRTIGITPYYHGDWGTIPPLDEFRNRVVLLPIGHLYDTSGYIDLDLDYVAVSDLTLEAAPGLSADSQAFLQSVQSERYKLVETFVPSFEAFHSAAWLGWRMHGDWRYTRPIFYLYERRRRTN